MSQGLQLPFSFVFAEEQRFESFITTPANAALLEYLQKFGMEQAQFCYLWGVAGSGKSHLLQALCQRNEQAIYLPLQLMLEFGPASLQGLDQQRFLVLDDLQLIAGQRDWEEALFYLFNALHQAGAKLCVAADQPPTGLGLQLADLVSRLQLALIFEVRELAEPDKQALLMQRAAQRGIELKPEVASFIMARSARGMQQLTAVLDRLDHLSLAEKRRVTIPFVKQICGW